jgi:hypothetical protein
MYLFAACSLFSYAYITSYEKYYCIVHLFAITGIVCYIRAYQLNREAKAEKPTAEIPTEKPAEIPTEIPEA